MTYPRCVAFSRSPSACAAAAPFFSVETSNFPVNVSPTRQPLLDGVEQINVPCAFPAPASAPCLGAAHRVAPAPDRAPRLQPSKAAPRLAEQQRPACAATAEQFSARVRCWACAGVRGRARPCAFGRHTSLSEPAQTLPPQKITATMAPFIAQVVGPRRRRTTNSRKRRRTDASGRAKPGSAVRVSTRYVT